MPEPSIGEQVIEVVAPIEDMDLSDALLIRRVQVRPEHWYESSGVRCIATRDLIMSVGAPGRGAVSFDLSTPIYPDLPPADLEDRVARWRPLGALTLHYAAPPAYLAEEDGPDYDDCTLTGGDCWLDATYLQADKAVEILLDRGVTGVWSWLAEEWLPQVVGSA